ncbi:MAG: ABC transporter permease subunit [Akkermansiaceae bacterium]
MILRKIGWIWLLGSLMAGLGELLSLSLPTLRWGFEVSREIAWLHWGDEQGGFLWFGWLGVLLGVGFGVMLLKKFPRGFTFTPITQRRLDRFKSIKRGHRALIILGVLACVAALDHLVVGNEPLIMKYEGKWYFPALVRETQVPKGKDFGIEGDAAEAPVNYRKLRQRFDEQKGEDWLLMPPIPYAPTQDTVELPVEQLQIREDGLLYRKHATTPHQGQVTRVYDMNNPNQKFMQMTYRRGMPEGMAEGWDRKGERVYAAQYANGKLVPGSETWNGEGELSEFLQQEATGPLVVYYSAAPPSWSMGHLLGTTPQREDVLAYLFGGLQVNFKAALFYIPFVYMIGISVGLLMGFFGGAFDLLVQRLIEVFSNIPFLFVIIIVSESFPKDLKEQLGLGVILLILVIFGWMGMTYLMRTAALKEKARDYVAASRVIGCTTPRILFQHILPNSVAILVTLVPFSISGLILGLTSLDYLGFGLPPEYATWGTLLREGLTNLSAPWLVSSAFVCLVSVLILVTFVGEAVREAFDPKKFTYYK